MSLARKLLAVLLFGLGSSAIAQTQTAVEYQHAAWDHYFVTAFPDEIALLDGGGFGGAWQRTGQTFEAWSQPVDGSSPACRFFSTAFAPRSSHFYTPLPDECATVRANPAWQFEAIAFHLKLADARGACPTGSVPLYRLYNNGAGGAPNHRYTPSTASVDRMRVAGWTLEGNAQSGVFACVPPTSVAASPAEGRYLGTSDDNEIIFGIVLDSGASIFTHTYPDTSAIEGVVFADSTASGGRFTAVGVDVLIGHGVDTATIAGIYTGGPALSVTLSTPFGSPAVVASFDATFLHAADPVRAAGTFSGALGSAADWQIATVTLSAAGIISGSSPQCAFDGVAVPRGGVDLFDVTIAFADASCPFGKTLLFAIGSYDAFNGKLLIAGPNAARSDGFVFAGAR